jgi:putative ABC transport system permease protein
MSFFQDVKFAVRMLLRDPGPTAVMIIALALGIGVNTTVFTLVNAVLFRGLPFEDPDRVMHLSSSNHAKNQNDIGVSYPDFKDWKAQTKAFKGMAGSARQKNSLALGWRPAVAVGDCSESGYSPDQPGAY